MKTSSWRRKSKESENKISCYSWNWMEEGANLWKAPLDRVNMEASHSIKGQIALATLQVLMAPALSSCSSRKLPKNTTRLWTILLSHLLLMGLCPIFTRIQAGIKLGDFTETSPMVPTQVVLRSLTLLQRPSPYEIKTTKEAHCRRQTCYLLSMGLKTLISR